jgi:hypothetical protein
MTSQSHTNKPPTVQLDELIARPALSWRLAPELHELALRRVITWAEAAFVLDAVEFFDESATRHARIVHRLLGGEESR